MALAQLPRLVQEAISSACHSDRQLSWKIQESAKGTLIQLVWKPALTVVPRQRKADMVGSNWNTMAQSAENVFASRSEKKRWNPPSRQRRSAKRLAEFLDKKKQLAADNSDPSSSGDPAACGGNPTLAVSNRAVSTAAETSSADKAGTVEDPQVLATPGTSLALELSGCKQIEFEVRDDSPGLQYTAPDNTTKWTPVVVNRDGHESEFMVVDPEGIPIMFLFSCSVKLHTCVYLTDPLVKFLLPLQREQGLKLILS